MRNVLLDNDFISSILKVRCADPISVFTDMFSDLQVNPYIHQYIYENELDEHYVKMVKALIDNGKVRVLKYDDIFAFKDFSSEIYDDYVKELYEEYHMELFPENRSPRERLAGKSLGEMHSLIAANFLKWDLFFSNDGDSKYIVKERFNIGDYIITVCNMEEVLEMLPSNSSISRNIKRALKTKKS